MAGTSDTSTGWTADHVGGFVPPSAVGRHIHRGSDLETGSIPSLQMTAEPWTTYTSTLTNITIGNGGLTSKYVKLGRTVHYRISLVWGSTTSASGIFKFTLPFAPITDYRAFHSIGILTCEDTGVAVYEGHALLVVGGQTTIQAARIGGSGAASVNVDATNPFTWGNTDAIQITGTYEAAS